MSVHFDNVIAVILAGGFGTRVRHLLPNIPKPMAPVAGKPFLEWIVRYLAQHGIKEMIISTGYLADVVARHFRGSPVPEVKIHCEPETTPLGTAGGFLNAIRTVKSPPEAWLVLNGDSLVFADLALMAEDLAQPDVDGVMLGSRVPDASRYGSLGTNSDRDLVRFAEKKPGAGVISAGVYLLRGGLVQQFPSATPLGFENDVFPALLGRGARLKVVETNAPFLDIGTEETLSKAEGFIQANLSSFGLT